MDLYFQSGRFIMNNIKNILLTLTTALFVGGFSLPVMANEIVLSGSVTCPAGFFTRKNGTEIHDRTYGLRNFNNISVVTITRVQAWDNDGTNTFDGLPGASGFKSTLNPHESGRFTASNVLPVSLPPFNIQQIRIDYTMNKPGIPLSVGYSHFVRDANNYQVARNSGSCKHILSAPQYNTH